MLGAPFFEADLRPAQRSGKTAREPHATPLMDRVEVTPLPALDDTPVATIMSTRVVTFPNDMSIEAATALLLERGISGAPVVDEAGRPIGMVSKTDLLEALHGYGDGDADDATAGPTGEVPKALGEGFHVEQRSRIVVGDIMVPYLLAVSNRSPISLAAALMAYEGVHRLLVLDEANTMVGIVSALDVLRWLAQLSGFCLPHYTQRQRP